MSSDSGRGLAMSDLVAGRLYDLMDSRGCSYLGRLVSCKKEQGGGWNMCTRVGYYSRET